eukprot:1412457-Rhodomonas_salina.3
MEAITRCSGAAWVVFLFCAVLSGATKRIRAAHHSIIVVTGRHHCVHCVKSASLPDRVGAHGKEIHCAIAIRGGGGERKGEGGRGVGWQADRLVARGGEQER